MLSNPSITEIVLVAVLVPVCALGLGIGGYVLGSYFLMRKHAAQRTFGATIREIFRETILAAVTQPFLPIYYLLGHRMEPFFVSRAKDALSKVPVIFVHGYMQNRVGFLGLARALSRKGIGPLYGFNYPWFVSIPSNAKRLERFVERICRETKSTAVDLVCHSMGGLVALEMMRSELRKDELKVRRLVTIATPHAGVMWRGPVLGIGATMLRRGSKLLEAQAGYALTIPTLSLFSTHDNIVHPKESSQLSKRGGRDIEIQGFGHLSILFSPEVAEHVASFLAEPSPSRAIVSATDGRGSGAVEGERAEGRVPEPESGRESERRGDSAAEAERSDVVVESNDERRREQL